MRIAIVDNGTAKSLALKAHIQSYCDQGIFQRDDHYPQVVISIGGDGTLLSAVHLYQRMLDQVRFAAIHTGHLGFYTDWQEDQVPALLESLQKDQGEEVSYPLLEVTGTYQDGHQAKYLALNEATIRKVNGTMACQVSINGELFENFRGDGLCVSTPTGSTGVNKSLGGAVIHPSTELMQLTEMASINNRVYRTLSSPMIFSKKDQLVLVPNSDNGMVLSIDHLIIDANQVKELHFAMSSQRVAFVAYCHTHFWDRVEDAFIGSKQNLKLLEGEG